VKEALIAKIDKALLSSGSELAEADVNMFVMISKGSSIFFRWKVQLLLATCLW
jgi:hypothetical protein